MSELINWFAEPLAFPFMQNALLTALIVSITCGLLSCYLVLKGWSLIGDALSHSIVPGVAGAYMLGLPFSASCWPSCSASRCKSAHSLPACSAPWA